MRRSTRSLLQIAGLGIVAILGISLWSAHQNIAALDVMVRESLQAVYDETALRSRSDSPQSSFIAPDTLRDCVERTERLTSFIKPEDIYFSKNGASTKMVDLVMVVRLPGGKYYGITGKRKVRPVDLAEFSRWDHNVAQKVSTLGN